MKKASIIEISSFFVPHGLWNFFDSLVIYCATRKNKFLLLPSISLSISECKIKTSFSPSQLTHKIMTSVNWSSVDWIKVYSLFPLSEKCVHAVIVACTPPATRISAALDYQHALVSRALHVNTNLAMENARVVDCIIIGKE